jgi:hypothetical protein
MLITKTTTVDTKLMKIVLYCTNFLLNEAIDSSKAKVDTKLIKFVLKCAKSKLNLAIGNVRAKLDTKLKYLAPNHTKSKLNQAINKINAQAGNLDLKINMQSAYQVKLGRVTRKLPKLETKWAFLS